MTGEEHDIDNDLWLVYGLSFKNAVDGEIRHMRSADSMCARR